MTAQTVKFRRLHRPPSIDINQIKEEISPGAGDDWSEVELGEEYGDLCQWRHVSGAIITMDKHCRVVVCIDKTIRGERVTIELHGASIPTAKAWVEML